MARTAWRDWKKRTLDASLGDIVLAIEQRAAKQRDERAEAERARRERD